MKIFLKIFLSFMLIFSLNQTINSYAANDVISSNGIKRTIKFSDQDLYLDFGNQKDAIAKSKSNSITQEFYFVYYPYKKAYKIYSASDPSLILAFNDTLYSTNVFFTKNGDLDEHFWKLEQIDNNGKVYIKNCKKSNGYEYLGARHNQGYMNVSIGSKNNYTNHYTEITISPEINTNHPDVLTNGGVKEIKNLNTSKNLYVESSNYNVILANPHFGNGQSFYLDYNESKNAYKIINVLYDWTALAVDNNYNVISTSTSNNLNQFWRLEYNLDNSFTIVNILYPDKVLDIKYDLDNSSYNVILNNRENTNSQKFLLKNR